MNIEQLTSHILKAPVDKWELDPSVLEEEIDPIVQKLKDEADRHWFIDPQISLQYAEKIIAIGHYYENPSYIALGMMSKGDALRYLAQYDEAWEYLRLSGDLFLEISDEVGWARTCIGRLPMCIQVDRIDETLLDADKAREIFVKVGDLDKYARIINNICYVRLHQSMYTEVVDLYANLDNQIIEALPSARLVVFYNNLGYAYFKLGDLENARRYYDLCLQIDRKLENVLGVAVDVGNIASIDVYQGRYRQALLAYHQSAPMIKEKLPEQFVVNMIYQAICYQNLNQHLEVINICNRVIAIAKSIHYPQAIARLLNIRANSHRNLKKYDLALDALNDSTEIYIEIKADALMSQNALSVAEIEFLRGHIEDALQALNVFLDNVPTQSELKALEGKLLLARIFAMNQQYEDARLVLKKVIHDSKNSGLLTVWHNAHTVMGEMLSSLDQSHKSLRHFMLASLINEKMQDQLTLTMRSSMMADKVYAYHKIICHYLAENCIRDAFFHLQRIKTQAWMGFLANVDELMFDNNNHASEQFSGEINILRRKHHSLYQKVFNHHTMPEDNPDIPQLERDRKELAETELSLRKLLEQVTLNSSHGMTSRTMDKDVLFGIQQQLADDDVLIEFYMNDNRIYVFVLTHDDFDVIELDESSDKIETLVNKLQFNVDCALRTPDNSTVPANLAKIATRLSDSLYDRLFSKISDVIDRKQRLFIVPYGTLHYIPYHILTKHGVPLIRSVDVVILPFSGFLLHEIPDYPEKSHILANNWNGQLLQTDDEIQMLEMFGAFDVLADDKCVHSNIADLSGKILHIATHSEFRLDLPELSYIYLNDGHLFATDLIQNNLRYDLVVLSACETGRAQVTSGDDLIGLGHAFLYSGSSSVLATLWRVEEESTYEIMTQFYTYLHQGQSKAQALRNAQLDYLDLHPQTHPAFWGAFQLLGNPNPIVV